MIFKAVKMKQNFAIAIHGGAGTIEKEKLTDDLRQQYEHGLKHALMAGLLVLQENGNSLDAVEAAVIELENYPLFNAGRGAAFNYKGSHEMDAAIMDGKTLKAGAVAVIHHIKNPIKLARAVMEKSDYVFLCGEGACDFAKACQLEQETDEYFYTESRYHEWQKEVSQNKFGTVGAVALDAYGHLAAATSTGGLSGKKYGRVGDSPVIGGGTYANENCAISCTGDGEQFIRAVVAYDIASLMDYAGLSLKHACTKVMQGRFTNIKGNGGLIAIDKSGNIEMPFNTEGMYRACYHPDGKIEVNIFEK